MRTVLCRRDLLKNTTAALAGLLGLLMPGRSSAARPMRSHDPGAAPTPTPDTPGHEPAPCWVFTYDAQPGRESTTYDGAGKLTKSYEWRGERVT